MRIAPLALLLVCGFSPSLYALDCNLTAGNVPLIRQGGLAEGIGDLTITCANPPSSTSVIDIKVSLPTAVTSRGFTGTSPVSSDALLLVNEPGSGYPGAPDTQVACTASDVLAKTCSADANVFPGFIDGNTVTFHNVPIPTSGVQYAPPPGLIVLRITNIRLNLAAFNGAPPNTVTAAVTMSGSITPSLSPPTAVVGYYQAPLESPQLLVPDLSGTVPSGGLALSQCVALNKPLALDPASPVAPDGISFVLRISEAFASAFKSLSQAGAPAADVNTRPVAEAQNTPGQILNGSETMFFNPSFPGSLAISGLATQATRLLVRFTGPPFGVQVHAPVYERGKGLQDSRVRLVAAGPDGSWPTYDPLGPLSTLNTYYSTSQVYVYEFTTKAPPLPYLIDTIDLPFYLANPGQPYVGAGTTSVSVTLAPTSTDSSPSAAYIPRFVDTSSPIPVANLTACAGAPVVKTQISSKSGPSSARIWQIGVNNYGTAAATNARITGVALTQTFGPACTPVVGSGFPVSTGTVAASTTVNAPVPVNFTGCSATSRFKVDIGYAADGGIAGTSTYFNQFQ